MLMLGQMRVRLMLIEVQNEREKDATDRQMQTGGLNCEIKKKVNRKRRNNINQSRRHID